jgi:prolipoprotein diacylglyceryltransferase
MFDVSGGLIIALIAALVYSQQKHLPFWATLDSLTPMLAVISIFIGLANLASGMLMALPPTCPGELNSGVPPAIPRKSIISFSHGHPLVNNSGKTIHPTHQGSVF